MTRPQQTEKMVRPGWAVALCYALTAIPLGATIAPLATMIPAFYSETFGLPIAAVGLVAGLMRIYDFMIDPWIGSYSDRLKSPRGRRSPIMLIGLPIAIVGIWLTFAPPTMFVSIAYFAFALFVLSTGISLVLVPYYSWGAEQPANAAGRVRMLGLREVLLIVGVVAAATSPTVAALLGFASNGREAMLGIALTVSIVFPAALIILFRKVGEPPNFDIPVKNQAEIQSKKIRMAAFFSNFFTALSNNPSYRMQLIAFFLVNLASYIGQATFYFFIKHILSVEEVFGPALMIGAAGAVASAPIWIWLSGRFELHRLIAAAIFFAAIGRAVGFSLLPPDQPVIFLALDAALALLAGAAMVLAPTLQAASIDYDTIVNRRGRAGTYIAISTVVMQSTAALAFVVIFPILGLTGFDPASSAPTPEGLRSLFLIAVWVPLPISLLGAAIIWFFPLHSQRIRVLSDGMLRRAHAHAEG